MSFNSTNKESDFPSIHLCPKNETGVLNFLSKNPEFDGRGTVIAIFDSGVDPGANGLNVTSTGLPKVIERFDCSGAGDVDMSKIVTPDEDGYITGISGRKLMIPSNWINPSGQYHVGVKPVYELYTKGVKERIEVKRKEDNWDKKHRLLMAEANRKLTKEQSNGNKSTDNLTPLEKLDKEDIEAQLEVLQSLEKKYKTFDFGPMLDCVLWNDGMEWRASLSTEGDLDGSIVLGEYSKRQEFAPLSKADQMNVSINVHDNGKILEIVGICSSHGTHVSSIAAGYFPENPELNGVAPGAQIMSFTIGDGRLGSMETGTALVRAMAYVMQNSSRINVINMSYGEHAHWNTVGRIGELMKEVVDKHGIIWVASAGNHGPALSTVGSPPWLNANVIIGVGAYVSPEMMAAEYSLRQKLPGMPYSWSSRGPCMDGDLGVSVSAPGGAICSVPNFTLRSVQLMNGTSMAAPHCAGCVAVILSGAINKGFKWSPYSVRKALEHSAQHVPGAEPYACGHGLVQVEKAFHVLEKLSTLPERDVRFNITVTPTTGSGSGWPMKSIYIRDPPVDKSKEYSINIDPVFFKEDLVEPEAKINFRMNLCLLSTVPWVHVPKFFDLANMQRAFNAKVDVEGLSKGVHFAKIEAFEACGMERGPVFTVFVTAIIPETLPASPLSRPLLNLPTVMYEPGLLKRYFISIPKGASWAVLNLKLAELPGNRASDTAAHFTARFVIHVMTLLPGQSCKSDEYTKMVALNPLEESNLAFKVTEGKVLELVVGRWWSEPVELASLSGTITFRSLYLNKTDVSLIAGDLYQKFSVMNSFGAEDVQPVATLKHQVCLLRPSESRIVSLPEPRDVIPQSRVIYQLENTYNFSLSRATATETTFNCCLLSDTLYESEYESQMWQLYNKDKKYLGCGDAYPSKWNIKLEKGDYILRLHIRHEKREALEKLMVGNAGANGSTNTTTWSGESQISSLPVLMSLKLPSSITLDIYQNQHELQDYKGTKKGTGWSAVLKRESSLNLFLSGIITDKSLKTLPSSNSTMYLQGTLTIHKDEVGKKMVTYPLKITLPDPVVKPKPTPSKDTTPLKTKIEEMTEQLRDVQITWIPKLEAEDSKKLYEKLVEAYDSHLPLHIARLQFLDNGSPTTSSNSGDNATTTSSPGGGGSEVNMTPSSPKSDTDTSNANTVSGKKKPKTPEICKEMIQIADKVLSLVDQAALLAFIGTRSSAQLDNGKTKQLMDKQRQYVSEALMKKGIAMAELLKMNEASSTTNTGKDSSPVTIETLDGIFFEIQKYFDINDARVLEFAFHHAMAKKQYCRALKLVFKLIDGEPTKWNAEIDAKIIDAFKALEWDHCVWLWEGLLLSRYPTDYRPF